MQTIEIHEGIVLNRIVIQQGSKAEYERLSGNTLIDVEDYLPVEIGDSYDAETNTFWREGQRVEAIAAHGIRAMLLQQSDYTQLLDYPCSDAERDAWRAYRQALRDLPAQATWPDAVSWPTAPTHDAQGTTMQHVINGMLRGSAQ